MSIGPAAVRSSFPDSGTNYSTLASWRAATGREAQRDEHEFRCRSQIGEESGRRRKLKRCKFAADVDRVSIAGEFADVGQRVESSEAQRSMLGRTIFISVNVAWGISFDIGASETKRAVAIQDATWTASGFHIDALGTVNKTNVLQVSTNLALWLALTNTTSAILQFTDTNASHDAKRFYRLKQLKPSCTHRERTIIC